MISQPRLADGVATAWFGVRSLIDEGGLAGHIVGLSAPHLLDQTVAARGCRRDVAFIEETGRRHDVYEPIQMTVAATNGETTWAFRYAKHGQSRSLSTAQTSAPCAAVPG